MVARSSMSYLDGGQIWLTRVIPNVTEHFFRIVRFVVKEHIFHPVEDRFCVFGRLILVVGLGP